MKRHNPQNKAGDQVPIKGVPASKNKEEETDDLHDREPATPENLSVRDAPPASPLRFYARLRHELETRGINYDKLPRLTQEGESPPCFDLVNASYDAWLASASMLGALVPYRYDMPAEPNYCSDCTSAYRRRAMDAGVCRFPNTRFERSQTVVQDNTGKHVEIELIGVSRSETVAIDLRAEYDPET